MNKIIRYTSTGLIIIGILLSIIFSQQELDTSASFVQITGIITKITEKNKVSKITIQPNPQIPLIAFNTPGLAQGQHVTIIAKVQDYKGRLELVAQKIDITEDFNND
ncbi:MAG: hypothetical protein Q7K43_06250 [Candidatus Woesearchaeota archaeon]|nr:hypothetical protein [Candidatus Woesearchaeota archaeon]